MAQVKIWIDADSCPSLVRNHTVKIANSLNIPVTFVANKKIPCALSDYEMVICSQEKDAADNHIFDNVQPNDLVITRDIVFAERLVSKGICTINDRGTVFSKENIGELLSERNFDFVLAQAGVVKHFSEGYTKKQFALFANCFDKVIHNLIKKN